jgi:serpin B
MRQPRFAIVSAVVATFLAVAVRAGETTSADVAQADNRVGFKLFAELVRNSPGTNILISPASIAFALGVAYNGAGGETAAEMACALELQGMDIESVNGGHASVLKSLQAPTSGVELRVANSLWVEQRVKFHPKFIQTAKKAFESEVTTLELSSTKAVARINNWVREKTRGKIDGIVDRLSPDDVLVILNAVYFHGSWEEEFDARATRDKGFRLVDRTTRPLPMMSRTGDFPYFEGPNFQAVALPYSDKVASFYVVLPDTSSSLAAVVADLTSATWTEWTRALSVSRGNVALPRFEMSYDVRLNESLAALGMKRAFDESADFAAMADVRPLFISDVRHKSRIEVNERGTQAAASTSVTATASIPIVPFVMIIDRPFLCAIQDRVTGLVLFLGAVTDPRRT